MRGVNSGQPTCFQGVTALLSIGGWTGSGWFSTAVATSENRTAFVDTVLDLVSKYDLDGIDFELVTRIFPGDEIVNRVQLGISRVGKWTQLQY